MEDNFSMDGDGGGGEGFVVIQAYFSVTISLEI